jgi:hypothetical protein
MIRYFIPCFLRPATLTVPGINFGSGPCPDADADGDR